MPLYKRGISKIQLIILEYTSAFGKNKHLILCRFVVKYSIILTKSSNIMPKRNVQDHNLAPVEREKIDPTIGQKIRDQITTLTHNTKVIILPMPGVETNTPLMPPLEVTGKTQDSAEENPDWDPYE